MATVTKRFKDNFDYWIANRIECGEFTEEQAEELRGLIRTDLTPGKDQLRQFAIDDHEERFKLWDDFFSIECAEIRSGSVIGINARIRASIASEPMRRNAA